MTIEQTKCDYCGKIHDTPHRFMLSDTSPMLSVSLRVKDRKQYLDFCNEKCLLKMLLKRQKEK